MSLKRGGGRFVPRTAGGGVEAAGFAPSRRLPRSGAGPGCLMQSRWSSGDLGVHGGSKAGKLDDGSRGWDGSGVFGVFTKDSRSSPVSMLRCAGVEFRGAFVSLPVKMERGSHIEMPRCNSSDWANAFERRLAGHAAKVGVVQPRLWIF